MARLLRRGGVGGGSNIAFAAFYGYHAPCRQSFMKGQKVGDIVELGVGGFRI